MNTVIRLFPGRVFVHFFGRFDFPAPRAKWCGSNLSPLESQNNALGFRIAPSRMDH